MNQSQTSLVNPYNPLNVHVGGGGLERFTNDVWLWFMLCIDLVSVTFYTIPTYISFFEENLFKILF